MTGPPRPAAFFDFDRTVIHGDAGVSFGRELLRIRRGRARDSSPGTVGWAARNVLLETGVASLMLQIAVLRTGHALGVVKRSQTIRKAYSLLKGIALDDLRLLAQDYFDDVLSKRLYREAGAEMEKHRAEGHRVVVVSTGMHIVVDPVKQHLPVDDVIACDLVTDKGIITGDVTGPLWGEEKADAVRKYAHGRGLSLPRSYAYSDHISDLHFLQLVGHPVVVNPDIRLRFQARRKKWPIERWNKLEERVSDPSAA